MQARSYKLGSLYALAATVLYGTQDPFSFLAAKQLDAIQFVFVVQVALLISVPLLLARENGRRDILALLADRSSYWRLGVILAVNTGGLVLYNAGLAHSHPVIVSAILSLAPFWAALSALFMMSVPFPVSVAVFCGCLAGAFLGGVTIAWSQSGEDPNASIGAVVGALRQGSWIFAVPVPICTTLGATLVSRWFSQFDESATIAANFLAANAFLIPATLLLLYGHAEMVIGHPKAIVLLILGTIIAASIGRVLYQIALSATGADNGYVSMFLNLVPALSALTSLALSWWIPDLKFHANWTFFLGLVLIGVSLLVFSSMARTRALNGKGAQAPAAKKEPG